jgi:hypothetical protein
MEMFKNIRLKRGNTILQKKRARLKRTRFKGNINNAKSIGLVWDASNPDDFRILSQFHQKMADRNIDLKIIGFFPGKHLPDKLTAIRYLSCLKNDDLNITFRPVSNEANTFISTRFDGFKVGIFDNGIENPPFDLMMEFKNPVDINVFLTQVIYYLEMINSGSKI